MRLHWLRGGEAIPLENLAFLPAGVMVTMPPLDCMVYKSADSAWEAAKPEPPSASISASQSSSDPEPDMVCGANQGDTTALTTRELRFFPRLASERKACAICEEVG